MRKNNRVIGILLSTLVAGCGVRTTHDARTAEHLAAETPAAAYDGPRAAAPQAASGAGSSAEESGGDWVDQDALRSFEPTQPKYRPGLATTWGEDRTSHVSTAPFVRANSDPFSVVQFFYNDARGVQNMLGSARPAHHGDGSVATRDGAISVRLLDSSGRALPSMTSRGRTYVIGEEERRYVIEIQNHTPRRFEVVAAVDGLDVIDGQPGSFDKRGYLVRGWSRLVIDGFRRSMTHVAAFRFGAVNDSYAAKKGDATNVGIIGVAFFHEEGEDHVIDQHEAERRHRATPFPDQFAVPPR